MQGQIGCAVQVVQNLSHITAVLGLVKLGVEDNALKELTQILQTIIMVHNRQANQNSLTGGNIGIHMIQIQQQHFGIQHIILSCGDGIDYTIEHTHQAALIHRTTEELSNRYLRSDIESDVLGSVDLLECHRSKSGNGIVRQHAQSHGVQLISGLNFIDQISTGALVFKSEVHSRILPLC